MMLQTFDPTFLEAFARLLARPDPADLPRRAHIARYEGDPHRRVTRLPAILMGWLQRRYLETDVEAPLAAAMRMPRRRGRTSAPVLRLLRPTGTD
jgi:hypothetical protein